MNYFIAPRSGERSYKNFKSTIIHGVPFEAIAPFLTDEGRRAVLAEDIIYSWGNRPGTRSQWETMEYGDKVIFYAKGELVMFGEIYYKQQSPDLALAMWPPDENGQPWEYTYFIRNIQYIKMPIRAFNWAAGYKDNFIVQGFIALKLDRVQRIVNEYGSVEELLSVFSTTVSEEIPQASDKLYVNISPEIAPIIRSDSVLNPKRHDVPVETRSKTKKPVKIDYLERSRKNALIGSKGEAIVFQYEKDTLIQAGRNDLAAKVTRMSDADDSLGYDILSYELDGTIRYIEVKTSSQKTNTVRFYMSDNEMRKSNELENYFVYFVDAIDTMQPRITPISCPFSDQLAISPHTYVLEAVVNT